MKKQLVQALWAVANGQPQQQGEKTVYPSIREQLSAIKMLMSLDDWQELPPVAAEQEKPIAPAAPCAAEEVPVVAPSAIEEVNTSQNELNTPQKTVDTSENVVINPPKSVDTSEKQSNIKPKTTRPARGTYEEWLAQKELLERLLLEEKTKKIQAKLGKMTKSKSVSPASSV